MSELTDDQLDGLFRKSAEEFEPPFEPAAWQDMKTRLDTHDRPTPGGAPLWKSLLRWGLPICLFLLMVGGLYMYRRDVTRRDSSPRKATTTQPVNANTDTQPDVAKTAMQQSAAAKPQLTDTDSAPTTSTGPSAESVDLTKQPTRPTKPVSGQPAIAFAPAKPINQANGLVPGAGETNTLTTAGETNEPKVAYGHKRNLTKPESVLTDHASTVSMERSLTKTNDVKTIRQRTGKSITKRLSTRTQTQGLNSRQSLLATNEAEGFSSTFRKRSLKTTFGKGSLAATNSIATSYQPMIDQAEPAGLPDVRELTIRPANWPKPLVFTGRAIEASPIEAEPMAVVQKPLIEKGLSVRLGISPDLSSIGLKNFARPGTNVGVMLEYRFAPRWSVQTGIIQSTKIYKASASEYELSDYFKKQMYAIPQSVDGQCKMLDIPINIRYDVLVRPRADGWSPSRWFISGGVTSYIIEQEDYVYKYTGYAHNPAPGWSGKSGSYGFSQLNLSVGYERALTKRLSWQVEPFMKMPLRRVGYLNLNLLSTGTFFSIRYKL